MPPRTAKGISHARLKSGMRNTGENRFKKYMSQPSGNSLSLQNKVIFCIKREVAKPGFCRICLSDSRNQKPDTSRGYRDLPVLASASDLKSSSSYTGFGLTKGTG